MRVYHPRGASMTPSANVDVIISGDLNRTLQEIFPDDMAAELVIQYSEQLGYRTKLTSKKLSLLFAGIGRLHAVARQRKDVLELARCKTIGEYERKFWDETGDHHSSIYKYSSGHIAFPKLTAEEFVRIGSTKLEIATRTANACQYNDEQKQALLEAAISAPSVKAFQASTETTTGEGFSQGAAVTLYGSSSEVKEVLDLCADPEMQEKSGDKRQIGVVLASLKNFWAAEPGTY